MQLRRLNYIGTLSGHNWAPECVPEGLAHLTAQKALYLQIISTEVRQLNIAVGKQK